MSLQVKVINGVGGTPIEYDVTAAEVLALRGPLGETLPDLVQTVEEKLTQFTTGDVELTCRNEDGFWNSLKDPTSGLLPGQRYPKTWYVQIWRNGLLRWEGDIDPESVTFDSKSRECSFTVLGPLKRLEKYNAELVRRPIPRYNYYGPSGTGSAGQLTDATAAFTADQFTNHALIDSAGTLYKITGNDAQDIFVASGTPASGRYLVRPFVWSTNIGGAGSLDKRKLTIPAALQAQGLTVAVLGLAPGDRLMLVFATQRGVLSGHQVDQVSGIRTNYWSLPRYKLQTQLVEVELVGPQASDPTLTAYELIVKEDLTYDFGYGASGGDPYCDGCSCETPYYRDKTVLQLVGLLFALPGQLDGWWPTVITTTTPGTLLDEVLPYADFDGKNVLDALSELAAVTGAVLSADPNYYYFVLRDMAKPSGVKRSIDLELSTHEEILQWEHSYDRISVEGASGGAIVRGALRFPAETLEVQSDLITRRDWQTKVADRLWSLFGGRRTHSKVKLLDDGRVNFVHDPSFEGTYTIDAEPFPSEKGVWYRIGNATVTRDTSLKTHRATSCKVQVTGQTIVSGIFQKIVDGFRAGELTTLSLRIRASVIAGGVELRLKQYANGSEVADTLLDTVTDTGATWVERRASTTLHAQVDELVLSLASPMGSFTTYTAWIDEVALWQGQAYVAPYTFEEDSAGAFPTSNGGWSVFLGVTGNWTVQQDGSNKVLRGRTTVNTWGVLVANQPGTRADVELLADVEVDAAVATSYLFARLRSGSGYCFYIDAGLRFALGWTDFTANFAVLDQVADAATPGQTYRMRCKLEGALIQARFWKKGDPEPETWQLSHTTADTAAGYVGVGCYYANKASLYDNLEIVTGQQAPTFDLLDRVTLAGEEFVVYEVTEPLQSSVVPTTVELALVSLEAVVNPTSDNQLEDDAIPDPPQVVTVQRSDDDPSAGLTTFTVYVSWPFPVDQMFGWWRTVWNSAGARPEPDAAAGACKFVRLVPWGANQWLDFWTQSTPVGQKLYVDYQVVFADGRVSDPGDPYLTP